MIIAEAAKLFAANGFHGTGVAELELAAGIKRGALYYHIKSKNDLLYELSVRHVREAIEGARRILAEESDPIVQLRLMARVQLRQVADHHVEAVVWQREAHALTGEHAEKVQELRDEYEQMFASVIQAGVDQGLFRSADPIVAKGILGMLGYTYLWLRADGALSPEEVADRLMDLALGGELTDRGYREYARAVPLGP